MNYNTIANYEFGVNYEQLSSNEKEWVRDEFDNLTQIKAFYDKTKER